MEAAGAQLHLAVRNGHNQRSSYSPLVTRLRATSNSRERQPGRRATRGSGPLGERGCGEEHHLHGACAGLAARREKGWDPGRGPVRPQHPPHAQRAGQRRPPVRQRLGARLRQPRQKDLSDVHWLPPGEAGRCRGVERAQEKRFDQAVRLGRGLGRPGLLGRGHAARDLRRAHRHGGIAAALSASRGRPGHNATGRVRGGREARADVLQEDRPGGPRHRGEHERLRLPALFGMHQRLLQRRWARAGPARRGPVPWVRAPGPTADPQPGRGQRLHPGIPQERCLPGTDRDRPAHLERGISSQLLRLAVAQTGSLSKPSASQGGSISRKQRLPRDPPPPLGRAWSFQQGCRLAASPTRDCSAERGGGVPAEPLSPQPCTSAARNSAQGCVCTFLPQGRA